jgi:hypothetical protein
MTSRIPLDDINNTPGLINLGPIPSQAPVAAFNKTQHENLINTKGYKATHYRHALHPNKETLTGPSEIVSESTHRGYRYYSPRVVMIVPQSIKIEERLMIQAGFKMGSVLINIGGRYLDVDPSGRDNIVHVRPNDIIVMPSITDATEQRFEVATSKINRLKYRISGIDLMFDSEREYIEGIDFIIQNQEIHWINNIKSGTVVSCVYYFNPVYIVTSMLHSLRVIPANEFGHAGMSREAIYAPQQFIVTPSHLSQEYSIVDYHNLPPTPEYDDSNSVCSGIF